jgi:hypothetical protein
MFKEPLISIDVAFHNGDPMYLMQESTTHLREAAVKMQFQKIPGDGWAQNKHAEALETATGEADLTKNM